MATINNKDIVKELLENDGIYQDDPQIFAIYLYTTAWGNQTHRVVLTENSLPYVESDFVKNPILLWDRGGLKRAGKEYLEYLEFQRSDNFKYSEENNG